MVPEVFFSSSVLGPSTSELVTMQRSPGKLWPRACRWVGDRGRRGKKGRWGGRRQSRPWSQHQMLLWPGTLLPLLSQPQDRLCPPQGSALTSPTAGWILQEADPETELEVQKAYWGLTSVKGREEGMELRRGVSSDCDADLTEVSGGSAGSLEAGVPSRRALCRQVEMGRPFTAGRWPTVTCENWLYKNNSFIEV